MRIRWLTIDDILQRTGGELRGLAVLRVMLVLILMAFQSAEVSQSFARIMGTPLWIVPSLAGPALFAPLGFALAQARDRDPGPIFLMRRLGRTWPTLAAVVLLTLFAIGPVTSTRDLRYYALDPQTAAYLLNLVAVPQFRITGVFEFNELAEIVNPAMWMVPVYAIAVLVIGAVATGLRRWIITAAVLLCLAAAVAFAILGVSVATFAVPLTYAGPMLCGLLCALLGALAQSWSRAVPLDGRIALGSAALVGLAALLGDPSWSREPIILACLAFPAAYLAIWVSVRRTHFGPVWGRLQPFLLPFMLCAFPVQQAAITLGPRDQNAMINLALSAGPLLLFSWLAGWLMQMPRLAPSRREHVWHDLTPQSGARRRRETSLREMLRTAGVALIAGILFTVATLVLFALTYFALQRDSGGI